MWNFILSFLSKFYYEASRKNPNWSFTALLARRLPAAKMAPILSCQIHDNCGLSENLTGLMKIFADIGWVINHWHIKEYIHAFSFMISCVFIEKSSRQSVEAISGVAVFDRFYRDSGRKSACVYNVQSSHAA